LFQYFGGFASAGIHVHIMHAAGLLMVLIYMFVFFAPYRRMRRAVIVQDYPLASANLNQIRILVGVNTVIGLLVIFIASAGRYL